MPNLIIPSTGHRHPLQTGTAYWRRHAIACLGLAILLGLPAVLSTPAAAQEYSIVNLETNDLIYDPFSQRIYASVPSSAGPDVGNSITVIDPITGFIDSSVYIGSEPGPLAISDDGQFLYVGLNGAAAIRRYDIATATAGLQFSLGAHYFHGPRYAEDIEVLPGDPNAVAASLKYLGVSPRHAGVGIFDDGVMRPDMTQTHTGSNRIEFSESSSLLFGYNNETTEFAFRHVEVTADGATETLKQNDLISGFGVDIAFEQGIVYATTGAAVDPYTQTLLETFDVGPYSYSRAPVAADADLGKVFFVNSTSLDTFDMSTFLPVDSFPIEGISGETGSLIRWGPDGLAFRTSNAQIFLITLPNSAPAPEPPPNPAPDPAPAPGPVAEGAICDVEVSKASYGYGEKIVATKVRIANPTDGFLRVEGKFWLELEGQNPIRIRKLRRKGMFKLPAGFDKDFGPVTLSSSKDDLQPGNYEFSCRLIHPVSGSHISLDTSSFVIREGIALAD